MPKKAPHETREKLQLAAVDLIIDAGLVALTLDAVARRAGVSKGGLLHHFPTKDALLLSLVAQLSAQWYALLADELAREEEGVPGRAARAYIGATFARDAVGERLLRAVAQVVATYPALIEAEFNPFTLENPLKGDDGLPPGRALVIRIACDGVWFGEFAGLPLITDQERAELRAELVRLTQP